MISLITSLYRSDKYLDSYIKNLKKVSSVLLSHDIVFELIIVANNSTNKEQSLQSLSSEIKCKFIDVKREPLYASWNRGVLAASGDVVGFWNVDDVRYSEALIESVKLFKDGADFVYFPYLIRWYVDLFGLPILVKEKSVCLESFKKSDFLNSMPFSSFWLVRRDLFEQVGYFDEQFKIAGDFDWTIRAAKFTDKFHLVNNSAGIFRVDGGGLSSGSRNIARVVENNVICLRHGIKGKIKKVDEDLMKKYRVNKVYFNGIFN